MYFSDFRCKDVINVRDCRKLGRVYDVEFNEQSGCICKIMVPGCSRLKGIFSCQQGLEIPFCNICQIGPEVILVDIKDGNLYNDK